MIKIEEEFVQGKHPDPSKCEDRVFVNEHFVACIDGATSISVKVIDASGASEIVLASDGYPITESGDIILKRTRVESDAALAALNARDPLCIYENISYRPVQPGFNSFDDRSYIRFTLSASPCAGVERTLY